MGRLELLAALAALELVVPDVVIPHTERSLQVPMPGQGPLVTGRHTAARIPAFVTMGRQIIEQAERKVHLADVKLAAHQMHTEKPPVESLAKPITVFGLNHPMLQTFPSGRLPRVEPVKQLHRMLPGYRGLKTEVGCHSRPIQQIGLERHVLSNGRPRQPSN